MSNFNGLEVLGRNGMRFTVKIVLIVIAFCVSAAGVTSCRSGPEENNRGQTAENIPVLRAHEMIQDNKNSSSFIILDIRTFAEYKSGHIENAVNIDFYSRDFRQQLDELDRGKTYLVYCRTAGRTGNALPLMKNMGFHRVYNMAGGIESWIKMGLPVVE